MINEANVHEASFQEQIDFWKGQCTSIRTKLNDEIAIRERSQESIANGSQSSDIVPPTPPTSIDPILLLKNQLDVVTQGFIATEQSCKSYFMSLREEIEIDRQYSRKSSILLHGYRNLPKVNKHQFILQTVGELNYLFPGFNITPFHIDDAHPLPSKRNHNNKLVVIRFKNRWLKRLIIERFEGKQLKRPGVSVSQHLTEYTRELVKLATQVVGPQNISVEDTIIHAQCGGRSFTVKYGSDINTLKIAKSSSSPSSPVANVSPASGANLTPLGPQLPSSSNDAPENGFRPLPPDVPSLYANEYPGLFGLLTERVQLSARSPAPRGFPSRRGRGGFSRAPGYSVPLNHSNA